MKVIGLRSVAAVVIALLMISVTLVGVTPPASAAATCGSFKDVPASSPFCGDITWLSSHHITGGYKDGGYHPTAPVSRQAMAAFLYRLANPGKAPLVCGVAAFPDVSASSSFCGDVAWLDGEAITGAYKDGGYHPTAPVSRQAMAAFLYRLANPAVTPAKCTSAPFPDVLASSSFCGEIEWLVSQKITGGYADGGFHPTAAVSRQAMAAFLHRLDPSLSLRAGYVVFGAGTFRIGANIPTGTYRMPHAASSCYWERLSGFSGSFDDIIANDLPSGPTVVTINKLDAGFQAEDCAVWTSDLKRITKSQTSGITDGTWIVGTDLKPGRWSARGGSSCYWERLSGFSGSFDELIANDFGGTNPIVDIAASDKGFHTGDCGAWARIG